jgi:hypothetical protein
LSDDSGDKPATGFCGDDSSDESGELVLGGVSMIGMGAQTMVDADSSGLFSERVISCNKLRLVLVDCCLTRGAVVLCLVESRARDLLKSTIKTPCGGLQLGSGPRCCDWRFHVIRITACPSSRG